MMNNNTFDPEGQLEISQELICLLEWIITNQHKELQELIDTSFRNGLDKAIQHENNDERTFNPEAHDIILEFFNALKNGLHIAATNEAARKIKEQKLLPELKHIDTTVYDSQTLQKVLKKTTQACEENPGILPKYVLFKELLKNWKTDKKEI